MGNVEDFTDKYNFVENAYIINDKVYSLPSSAYLKGILYNREVFDKAGISRTPRTQEQFIKALSMIKERTEAVPFYTNYDIDWVLSDWSFFPYIEMSGDAKYRSEKFIYEKNPFLKGSNYYKSYKLLYDIVNKGLCEDASSSFDFGQICTKVNNGEIAAVVAGTWAYQQMKYAGNNHDAVAFMPFPNEIDGRQYSTIGVDYGYSISKNSKNKELARKFIDFMIDESGYAIDNDRISIVKSDPLPDVYSKINNLELKISDSLNDRSYYYLNKLTEKRNPESVESIREVIDEARKSDGDYDLLMKSWNDTWEESRSAGMKTYRYEELQNETEFSDDTSNGTPETLIMDNSDVEYSKTEKEYIRAAKKIKVGYLTNMAPFQYEEKNGREFVGLAKVICESVKTSTKMKFQYVPFTNSNDLVNALYSGQIDMAAGLTGKEEGTGDLLFSKSYFELANAIIKTDTLELSNLASKKEGYVKKSKISTEIDVNSKKISYSSMAEMVRGVNKGEIDFAVCNYYSANYYIKDGGYSHAAVVPLTEKSNYCLAFSKDVDTRLLSICNKCIYSFPQERIQMILMKYMDPQAKRITLTRYMLANPVQSALIIGGFVLFILGSVLLYKKEKDEGRKKHEMDIKRYTILSQLTDEYVFEYDFATDMIHFDSKFSDKFGFDTNVNLSDNFKGNESLVKFVNEFLKAKNTDNVNSEPFELDDSNNENQWYRMTSYRILDDKKNPQHVIGKLINVQDFINEREKIEQEADRDHLTSLYNRTGFERRISKMSEEYGKADSFVFAVLDMDYFKSVNDSLGHLGGDEALKTLADELIKISSDKIICSRYGGDEFVISMFDISKQEADDIFQKVVQNMNRTMNFEGKEHVLSISLGAVYCDEIRTTDQAFERADRVLYHVKQDGKNGYKLLNYEDVDM